MCGRFTLVTNSEEFEATFKLPLVEPIASRFNIAPTQPIALLTNISGNRQNIMARWGLIPGWCKNPDDFPLLINARSETAAQKSSFKRAMRHRRALIPASGFYEWRRPPSGKGQSQAFYVRPRSGGLVGMAALWETWMGPDGTEIDTAAIMTTEANQTFMPIHHRLPEVINPENFSTWLDVIKHKPRHVQPMLGPPDEDFWEAVPVGDAVNKVANTSPDIQERVEERPIESPTEIKQMDLF